MVNGPRNVGARAQRPARSIGRRLNQYVPGASVEVVYVVTLPTDIDVGGMAGPPLETSTA